MASSSLEPAPPVPRKGSGEEAKAMKLTPAAAGVFLRLPQAPFPAGREDHHALGASRGRQRNVRRRTGLTTKCRQEGVFMTRGFPSISGSLRADACLPPPPGMPSHRRLPSPPRRACLRADACLPLPRPAGEGAPAGAGEGVVPSRRGRKLHSEPHSCAFRPVAS
jgi:hypothetical protein